MIVFDAKRGKTVIEGRDLILRLFEESDLDPFLRLENDLGQRGEHVPLFPRVSGTLRQQFQEDGLWGEDLGRMLLTTKEGKIRGHLVFFKQPRHMSGLELGFALFREEDRGRGLMTEGLRLFSAYLFGLKPIPRLQLVTLAGNAAARRVAEKCGYQLEGTLRRYVFARGEHADCLVYSLLREECPAFDEVLQAETC